MHCVRGYTIWPCCTFVLGEPLLADEVFDEAIGLAIEHQLYEAVRQSTRLRARSAYENGDFSSACKWIRLCREYQDREIRREQASLSRFMQARHQSRLEELVTDQRPQELSLYMDTATVKQLREGSPFCPVPPGSTAYQARLLSSMWQPEDKG